MNTHNNTAPRFRAQAAAAPMGAAQFGHHAPELPPRLASSMAPPHLASLPGLVAPAPRHQAAPQLHSAGVLYPGMDNKTGSAFNDEDNIDDVDFLASKMAALGAADSNATHYQNMLAAADLQQRVNAQHQLLQLQIIQQQQQQQQAQAFQNLLLQSSSDPTQLREAMALLELQRAQLAATTPSTHLERAYAQQAAAQQLLNQRIVQQQLYALQAQHANQHQGGQQQQRHALAAQLEAGTLRREREREQSERRRESFRALSPDNDKARAAFENAPSGYFPPISPPVESAAGVGWTTAAAASGGGKGAAQFAEWPFGTNNNNNSSGASTQTSSTDSNTRAPSPSVITSSPTPPSAPPSAALGRFARARQELAAAQAAAPGATPLAALLSRGRSVDDDSVSLSSVATSPISELGPSSSSSRKWSMESSGGRQVASDSGHLIMKEPVSFLEWGYLPPAPRSQSFSSYSRPTTIDVTRRFSAMAPAASVPNLILRQPFGPPGSADELSQKNFASNIRRQAGINLGMLGRRTDSTESDV